MKYSKVTAIINCTDYSQIKDSLAHLNLPGVSVSPVQGYGDYFNEYSENGFSSNLKIEIYTTIEQAQEIANILSDRANEMTDGGGMVSIESVTSLLNVRKLGT